jgi:UDPglucose 6-dehydrogenase
MKLVMQGLWHLGCVSAAGSAKAGHTVVGLAENADEAARLNAGQLPIHEPGLQELFAEGLATGRLRFSADADEALKDAEICWVAYDTPVDSEDRADTGFVMERALASLKRLRAGQALLLSSQLPVGSAARLQAVAPQGVGVACSPENLRLGSALKVFLEPDRVVLGADDDATRALLKKLFEPITPRLEWMSAASAEMTKHAINAFLASSVVFINEIAGLCETHGADAAEVARGLKSESRIGPKAYLGPGAAFAGGTLARDLQFLSGMAAEEGRAQNLFAAALDSNRRHSQWPLQALQRALGALKGRRIAVLGLAYKPGTDTLRRSPAVELLEALQAQGAQLTASDPLVKKMEAGLQGLKVSGDAGPALAGAEALVLFHAWPGLDALYAGLSGAKPAVIDPQGVFPGGPPVGCPSYAQVGRVVGARP